MKCTVCKNAARNEIDQKLIDGASTRGIAGQYGLSDSSVSRHKLEHIPDRLVRAKDEMEILESNNLAHHVNFLYKNTLDILDASKSTNDLSTALKAIKEARGFLELVVKASEILFKSQQESTAERDIAKLRITILRLLQPYPEVKLAVAKGLMEITDNEIEK